MSQKKKNRTKILWKYRNYNFIHHTKHESLLKSVVSYKLDVSLSISNSAKAWRREALILENTLKSVPIIRNQTLYFF